MLPSQYFTVAFFRLQALISFVPLFYQCCLIYDISLLQVFNYFVLSEFHPFTVTITRFKKGFKKKNIFS